MAACDDERFHTCLMTPGKIGVEISPKGEVVSIKPGPSSQANRASVQVGWRVHSVEGEIYSREKLNSFVRGSSNYTVVFAERMKPSASAPAASQGGYPADAELLARPSAPTAPKGGYPAAGARAQAVEKKKKSVRFFVTAMFTTYKKTTHQKRTLTRTRVGNVLVFERADLSMKVGALRACIQDAWEIAPFEQKLTFKSPGGDVEIKADDSVPLSEVGLVDGSELILDKQVDPRYKMEKETALLEALAACRFKDALQVLQSSGAKVSPDCVRTFRASGGEVDPNWPNGYLLGFPGRGPNAWCGESDFAFGEDPCSYVYPALTVAMIAGTPRGMGHPHVIRQKELRDAGEHVAREPQVVEVVKVLLEMRANVNATGEEDHDGGSEGISSTKGKTPLCAAVQRGSPRLVRLLLAAGADPNHTVTADVVKGLTARRSEDPRAKHKEKILDLLREASERSGAVEDSEVAGA